MTARAAVIIGGIGVAVGALMVLGFWPELVGVGLAAVVAVEVITLTRPWWDRA